MRPPEFCPEHLNVREVRISKEKACFHRGGWGVELSVYCVYVASEHAHGNLVLVLALTCLGPGIPKGFGFV